MTQGKGQIYINWMDEYFDITVDTQKRRFIGSNANQRNKKRTPVRGAFENFLSGLGLSLRLFVPEAQKAGSPCGTHIPVASL